MIKILIVDDQKVVREKLKAILSQDLDLDVVGTAESGEQALELVKKLQPDVVLIDMEMPGMDGVTATRQICQAYPKAKVIILSMHDDDKYITKSIQAGAIGYLLKNTPPPEIKNAVRYVYRGYAQIGPGLLDKLVAGVEFNDSVVQQPPLYEQSEIDKPVSNPVDLTTLPKSDSQPNTPAWKLYSVVSCILLNALIWGFTFVYLKGKSPVYQSEWAVSLPASKSSTSVNLPGIAQAQSNNQSPYDSQVYDPRENYKFLASTEEVLEKAANKLELSRTEFGKAKVQIVDNTTLMRFSIKGKNPQQAQKKAYALQQALNDRLAQLKKQEISEKDNNLKLALSFAKNNLEEAQKRLAEYRTKGNLTSSEQVSLLSRNVEELRRKRAENQAQLQLVTATLNQLSLNLNVSSQKAADAFTLQSDPVFQQHLADYSRITAELVNLEATFLPNSPPVQDKLAEKQASQTALLQRGRTILGKNVSLALLESLSLENNRTTGQKASLYQEIVSLQGQQQGLKAQNQALDQQISQLEARLGKLSGQESILEGLKRDVRIAEAVFSSTITQLDLSKSDILASYPQLQMITAPSLPEQPASPKPLLVLLGSSLASLFLIIGTLSISSPSLPPKPEKTSAKALKLLSS